ncbi:MAG: hypothetical protein ACJATT_003005, partial [Myxococcota bacterium]
RIHLRLSYHVQMTTTRTGDFATLTPKPSIL